MPSPHDELHLPAERHDVAGDQLDFLLRVHANRIHPRAVPRIKIADCESSVDTGEEHMCAADELRLTQVMRVRAEL